MVIFPRAKINLGLNVLSRRDDGFHNIETLFYPIALSDALEFVLSGDDQDHITVTGLPGSGRPEDNIVLKAITLLRSKYNIPFIRIHLHKAIPAGAGLGGGSSDASHLLKAVSKYFQTGAGTDELKALALQLGSDCPFFIDSLPAYGSGRGEILSPAPSVLKGYYLVLLNPGITVSTGEAYSKVTPSVPQKSIFTLGDIPVTKWNEFLRNDFEKPVFEKHPAIKELKQVLNDAGALYSSMSGSGSSVFGIFTSKPGLPDVATRHIIWEGFMS